VSDPNDYNTGIIEEFRANRGKVGGYFDGATLLLLHTKGIKSGQPRVKPLVYLPDGERFVVFGTKGGAPTDPFWVSNVLADPEPEVELGDRTVPVHAVDITGPDADELYARQVERRPGFAEYKQMTSRWIPVIALEPRT
jgi:deazaflavin-dependent oxidoreductase (nitroreductase family)